MDELLAELRKRGVRLRADGDRLDVQAPRGALTAGLREALAARKAELLSMLTVHAEAGGLDDVDIAAHVEFLDAEQGRSADAPYAAFEKLDVDMELSYAWAYGERRDKLRDLYAKAQRAQWIADDALPWHTDVDTARPMGPDGMNPIWGSPVWERMTPREREQCNHEITAWTVSQFLHGEQGALLATAQIVDAVTDLDAKLYGASQVADEGRHVDVFNRYLQDKVRLVYPVDRHLKALLDMLLTDSRWDMKFLGMQILVEGAALSSLATLRDTARDPLLRDIASYVMGDEARHVAYGIVTLREHYAPQSPAFLAEREDFLFEGVRLLRDRFLMRQVWEKLGLPVRECMETVLRAPSQIMYRQRLFAKIVPTVKRLGLLSERQRRRFAQLGILQFEDVADPFDDAGGARVGITDE